MDSDREREKVHIALAILKNEINQPENKELEAQARKTLLEFLQS
jgi:hypothetical protein